nr:MAG TPA: hypothetical protein [Caudoviricetes sp.]DAR46766.1 MAG TPA: hypothetical protein [Caudoviricetes sp.]
MLCRCRNCRKLLHLNTCRHGIPYARRCSRLRRYRARLRCPATPRPCAAPFCTPAHCTGSARPACLCQLMRRQPSRHRPTRQSRSQRQRAPARPAPASLRLPPS